ncbi:MAG: LysR substrate-binding domain-containing protein [Cytophagales bacterium]|nr:LysR substrate-binding domain-containing protein [Cytophagales bacterium]
MELRHLRYFKLLAEELHFRKASDKLHIAQPALSRQVKELEKELGVTLFERNRRKVALSPMGKHLYNKTIVIFRLIEETKKELKELETMEVGKLRVGYVASALYSALPKFLTNLKKNKPRLQVSICEMSTSDQIESLRNGSLEVGFVRGPVNSKELTQTIVYKEDFALFLPANHPLAKKRLTDLRILQDEPFVFFPRHYNPGYFDKTISLCEHAGFSPTIQYEGLGSNTLLQMVGSGLGVTILPYSLKNSIGKEVKSIPLTWIKEKAELAMLTQANFAESKILDFNL